MANVAVIRVKETPPKQRLLPETMNLLEGVRRRAYELFQRRGTAPGNEIEDWIQADREIFQVPRMDLAGNDHEFQLQVALAGYGPEDIRVTARPDSLVIEGETVHEHRAMKGNVRFSEFGGGRVFRQVAFPESVDVNQVSATLDKGLLEVRAAKANHGDNKPAAA